jgi:hypothetical protein
MIYAPMNGDGGGGKPYELSEMVTTGLVSGRYTPIFGGYVTKNGICYVDCLLEIIQDLPNYMTFPNLYGGGVYNIVVDVMPKPKDNASVVFTACKCKLMSTSWTEYETASVTVRSDKTMRLIQYKELTRGSDRWALRIQGSYFTE